MRTRIYLGLRTDPYTREIFRAASTPTTATHGAKYVAVIGPFQTRRGAEYMRDYGRNNLHYRTVADAERIARRDA